MFFSGSVFSTHFFPSVCLCLYLFISRPCWQDTHLCLVLYPEAMFPPAHPVSNLANSPGTSLLLRAPRASPKARPWLVGSAFLPPNLPALHPEMVSHAKPPLNASTSKILVQEGNLFLNIVCECLKYFKIY